MRCMQKKSGGTVFETTAYPTDIHNTNPGNVGIGTDLPSEKLDVAGNLKVRQNATITGTLNVEPAPWNPFDPFDFNPPAPAQIHLQGRMGIGTNTPNALLNIVGGDRQDGLRVESYYNASLALASSTREYQIYARQEGDLVFYDQTGELAGDVNPFRMLIKPTGQVGINNANPAEQLDVVGNIKSSANMLANSFVKAGGTSSEYLMADGSVSTGGTGGSGVFVTTTANADNISNLNIGNVGIGTDLPSEKLDVAGNLKVRGNISNGGSNASGPYSIATGLNTTASGQYSTAMGESSVSNGYSTTALGIASTASGWGATAIGILSSAEGSASVALGSRAKAYSLSEIAVGQFNTAYALNTPTSTYEFNGADRIFVVGNGQDDNNLSDAMVVLKNGNTTINGTTTANSFVKAGGTSSQFLMADGSVSEGILATIAAMQGQITALQNQLAALPQPVLSTVTIGSQIWTSTNLNVTTYRDGTPIPEVQDPTAWANLTTGAWCHLNNDPANDAIYGKMYNHYALEDPRGLAPVGYHVPTFAEYDTLIQTLPVGECNLDTWYNAFALMSTGFYNGTNTSGFSALNGGARSGDAIDFGMPEMSQPAGAFDSSYTGFWSSDPAGSYNYIYLAQQCSIGSTNRQSNYGAYVRLIKN